MAFIYVVLMMGWLSINSVALAEWSEITTTSMGTEISVSLWAQTPEDAAAATKAVIDEMNRIDQLMSSYKPTSELAIINKEAAQHPVKISAELYDLIKRALDFSKLTDGAFDITYASVGYLYDFRKKTHPQRDAIKQHLPAVNYHHVLLDDNNTTIEFKRQGVRIDLGGIAKGHAVDRSIEILKLAGIQHAMITAGGDTRVLGDHKGRPWSIAIQNPVKENENVAIIPLLDEAISTSGDYERFFDEGGIRYHHIIDPETGDSARKVKSVSIIGPESTSADALSTSLFVMGLDKGMVLINSMQGYEAIIVDAHDGLKYSTGLQQFTQ